MFDCARWIYQLRASDADLGALQMRYQIIQPVWAYYLDVIIEEYINCATRRRCTDIVHACDVKCRAIRYASGTKLLQNVFEMWFRSSLITDYNGFAVGKCGFVERFQTAGQQARMYWNEIMMLTSGFPGTSRTT